VHRVKRRLLKIGLLMLAGAIVNVAVAWGCALRNWRLPLLSDMSPTRPFELWQRYAPSDWPQLGPRENERIDGRQTALVGYIETRVIQAEHWYGIDTRGRMWDLCEIRAGFPLYCMSAVSLTHHSHRTSTTSI
jgi:hypothetical protein